MIASLKTYLEITRLRQSQVMALAALAVLGGVLNVGLIALISTVLRSEAGGDLPMLALLFGGVAAALLICQDHMQGRLALLSEQSAATVREQLVLALDAARLSDLERMPHPVKQAAIGRDVDTLSTALGGLIGFVASSTTVICALLYMLTLFPLGALVVFAVIAMTVALCRRRLAILMAQLSDAQGRYDRFFRFSEDLLRGHKELKLDRSWASAFLKKDVLAALHRAWHDLGRVKQRQQRVGLLGSTTFLVLLGGATFLHAFRGLADNGISTGFVLALLLLNAPIQTAVSTLPALGAAMVAMRRICATLAELRDRPEACGTERSLPPDWKHLRLRNLRFSYGSTSHPGGDGADDGADKSQAALRAISLDIRRGDLVFLVGGNGSGKTTLAKVILGLYEPSQGAIWLDDQQVGPSSLAAYRAQFSTVFSDAHLFSRSFDELTGAARMQLQSLMRELRLFPKIDDEGRFDTLALSQGQKKRLGLACAMVDDKPILLLDEWTADQDPEFRALFYESFLPHWRQSGKTVIVITHDDRYFHHADLLVTLEAGDLRSVVRRPRTMTDARGDLDGIGSAA